MKYDWSLWVLQYVALSSQIESITSMNLNLLQ